MYKNILVGKSYYYGGVADYYSYNKVQKYYRNGWKHAGGLTKSYDGGHIMKYYAKVKKKVGYYANKKVKVGTKKVKMNLYAVGDTYQAYHYDEKTDTDYGDNIPRIQIIAQKKGYSTEYLTDKHWV